MKISIDTKEDSNEDIKKVIRMLQNIVGDSQEIFTNQPTSQNQPDENVLPSENVFTNIFGDASAPSEALQTPPETVKEAQQDEAAQPDSTDALFAELFSEEEIKKMDIAGIKKEEEEEQIKPKDKKYSIEFY